MKITKPFTIDSEIYTRFEKTIPSGERSQIVENLIAEFVKLRNPDKKALKAQREADIKDAKERLERAMTFDKQEADKILKEQADREAKLVQDEKNSSKVHFLDDCRKRAKLMVNLEFSLDPLTDILPSYFNEEQRAKFKFRWKELTNELVLKGEE